MSPSSRETSPAYRAALAGLALGLAALASHLALALRAVPARDLWVVLLASLYGLGSSHAAVATPAPAAVPHGKLPPVPPLAGRGAMRTQVLVLLGVSAVLSLGVPAVWVLLLERSDAQARLLAPHLFAMATQVLFELGSYRREVSVLVRLALPVFTTTYRLRLLVAWVEAAQAAVGRAGEGVGKGDLAMRALAVANLGFWVVVLFYFLLLKVVPRFFVVVPPDVSVRRRFEKESVAASVVSTAPGPYVEAGSGARAFRRT